MEPSEPSYHTFPNEWISWYMKEHKCGITITIDEIMRRRLCKVSSCIECPEAHFGKYDEYSWRCGLTDEVLENVSRLKYKCPMGYI